MRGESRQRYKWKESDNLELCIVGEASHSRCCIIQIIGFRTSRPKAGTSWTRKAQPLLPPTCSMLVPLLSNIGEQLLQSSMRCSQAPNKGLPTEDSFSPIPSAPSRWEGERHPKSLRLIYKLKAPLTAHLFDARSASLEHWRGRSFDLSNIRCDAHNHQTKGFTDYNNRNYSRYLHHKYLYHLGLSSSSVLPKPPVKSLRLFHILPSELLSTNLLQVPYTE